MIKRDEEVEEDGGKSPRIWVFGSGFKNAVRILVLTERVDFADDRV